MVFRELISIDFKATESRYNAALQLYGEKAEEADELRMDLEDVKQMYKQQVSKEPPLIHLFLYQNANAGPFQQTMS